MYSIFYPLQNEKEIEGKKIKYSRYEKWREQIENDVKILIRVKTPETNKEFENWRISPLSKIIKRTLLQIRNHQKTLLEIESSKLLSIQLQQSSLSNQIKAAPPCSRKNLYKHLRKLLRTDPVVDSAFVDGFSFLSPSSLSFSLIFLLFFRNSLGIFNRPSLC